MTKEENEEMESLKLTEEELDVYEHFRGLSPVHKEALISFIYELSLILYCTHSDDDE